MNQSNDRNFNSFAIQGKMATYSGGVLNLGVEVIEDFDGLRARLLVQFVVAIVLVVDQGTYSLLNRGT